LIAGVCGFAVKTKIAQDAGALAVIIANNVAGAPPGMAGVDSTIVIPTVSITLADANAIKAQLGGGVTATLGVDLSIRAGADAFGRSQTVPRQIRCSPALRFRTLILLLP